MERVAERKEKTLCGELWKLAVPGALAPGMLREMDPSRVDPITRYGAVSLVTFAQTLPYAFAAYGVSRLF